MKLLKSLLLIASLVASACEAKVDELMPSQHDVIEIAQPEVLSQTNDDMQFVTYNASVVCSLGLYVGAGHIVTTMLRSYTHTHQETCAQWSGYFATAAWLAACVSGYSMTYLAPLSTDTRERKRAWATLLTSALIGTVSTTAFWYGDKGRAL